MLNNVDLNRLRIFTSIYQLQSVREAARTLSLTPSAVSQSLKLLEKETKQRLFQRISRKMVPTTSADALFSVTQNFLNELEGVLHEPTPNVPRGHLKVGAPAEFGSRQVVDVISYFNEYHGSNFSIHFDLPDRLMALLIDGKIDLAFCDFGSYLNNYRKVAIWEPIFTEEAILVCSKAFYAGKINGDHSFDHLSSLPHVDYRQDAGVLALWYQHHFGRVPKNLQIKLVANNVNAVIAAARAGLGLAFIPKHLIAKDLKSLIPISIKRIEYKNPIMLVQLKDKVPSLLERKFVTAFKERMNL